MANRGKTCPLNEGGLRLLSNAGNAEDLTDWLERVITEDLQGTVKNAMFLKPYSRKLCGEVGHSQSYEQLLVDLSQAGWIEGARVSASAKAALKKQVNAVAEEVQNEKEVKVKKVAESTSTNVKLNISADKIADLQKRLAERAGKQTEEVKKPVAVVKKKKPVAVQKRKPVAAVVKKPMEDDEKVAPAPATETDSKSIKFVVYRNQDLVRQTMEEKKLEITQKQMDEICGSRFTVSGDKVMGNTAFVTLKDGSELELPLEKTMLLFTNKPKKRRKIESPSLKKRIEAKKEVRKPDPVKREKTTERPISINAIKVQAPQNTEFNTARRARTPVTEKRRPETVGESIRQRQASQMSKLKEENSTLKIENRKLNREVALEKKKKEIAQVELEKLRSRGSAKTEVTEAEFRELVSAYPTGPRQLEIRISSGTLGIRTAHLFLALEKQDCFTLAFQSCASDAQTAKDRACNTAFELLCKGLPYSRHFNQTQI